MLELMSFIGRGQEQEELQKTAPGAGGPHRFWSHHAA